MNPQTYSRPSPYYLVLRDFPAPNTDEPIETLEDATRIERLKFHIKTEDYFAMLATALGIVEEKLATCEQKEDKENPFVSKEVKLLRSLRADLRYAHRHYRILKNSPLSGYNI